MAGLLTWCNENKEWLFSGVGVLVLGGIASLFGNVRALVGSLIRIKKPSQSIAGNTVEQQPIPITEAMRSAQILFIDDDTKFKVVSILKKAGWQNTQIIKDVVSLDEGVISRTDIFFVDINGVGIKLGFKDEGLGLASALKTKYPEKAVIIYSAETKAERFHDAWKKVDTYLAKNADPYEFLQIVSEYSVGRGNTR